MEKLGLKSIWKPVLAIIVVVLIPFGIMITFRAVYEGTFTSNELILYPLLFGGLSIIAIVLIKKYLLNESLSDFNSGTGTAIKDLGWGILLTLVYFILFFVERPLLGNILPSRPNMELLQAILDMRDNWVMLVLWLGPVLWIGVALYEELIRVFLLSSLWKFSKSFTWIISVILFTSLIIGLAHWVQGPYGMVTIGIKSIVACWFYFKIRRFMPLVYAHVLYDGLQIATLLLTYPQ
ncbi:MAG: CPBP family intramembrane metalloprotease [Bacteroidia bacterium]|nr:CPBP family intramembrane metalloprotease [Bacteroidia bacterium]MBT8267942.1 CPBP family intramembrane metalloprotease [Bacteroidia bacterium]NNK69411.1 CPBP family intramembrane metalloprotease [Flavobacteriaceae bacterium]NNL80787.1 CPBP family intramembrane metalloprotease [Flavobacteriaceae bacterium]